MPSPKSLITDTIRYTRDRTAWADDVQPELDLTDESNPHSLINVLPKTMAEYLRKIPIEVLTMGDEKIEKAGNIGVTEKRLRHGFWIEYNYAQLGKRQMAISNIVNGVCRKEQFWQIVKNQWKLAYILTPPPDHRISREELLARALDEIRDILEQPHVVINPKTGKGTFDARIAAVKVKIYDSLSAQVHGAPVQRLETKTQSLNVNVEAQARPPTLEELDAQIREAEKMLGTQPKQVTHVEREAREATWQESVSEVRDEGMDDATGETSEGSDPIGEL